MVTLNVSIDWLCGLTNEMNNEDDIKTYSDLICLFLKIQKLEMAPYGFNFIATNKENGIVTEDDKLYMIIRDIQKMQDVLTAGTINQDIYDAWFNGFLEKYNKPLPTWDSISPSEPPEDEPPQD